MPPVSSELLEKVENRLTNLIVNKDQELADLIYDLGYEYENEVVDTLISGWTENQKSLINQITKLGYHGDFSIFWIRLNSDRLNKSFQRNVINLVNRIFPYNLIIFSNQDDTIWDFVNIKAVKEDPSEDDKEPKKRQYLRRIRIDQPERLRTAVETIAQLRVPEDGAHHFEIQKQHDDAFDVEKVTDAFFHEFKNVFSDFTKHLSNLTDDESWAHAFGLQFFNRLIFVYFIQKKRWMGNDAEFVKSYWEAYKSENQNINTFSSQWLDVLFFDAFNKKDFYNKEWLPEIFEKALKNAPYLNGGLFKKTDLDNQYPVEIYDTEFQKVFDFLQSYNFTISEDSPIEQDVAVDPEMIGKIFETMTYVDGDVEKAHAHGIVYTPRTEITLMCRLALVDRFTNEFGSDNKNLLYELFFSFLDEDKKTVDHKVSNQNLWPQIGQFLDDITVLDPAVGSGSFLVGMLNILADLKMRANSHLGIQDSIYKVKKNIVGRSLYGVDIMDWAVHVCELRLWLQLVVETDLKPEERTIEPLLPNLDLNIQTGDSLVQQVGNVNFSHLQITKLPSNIKGKLTILKGEKRKYFHNDSNRKFKSRRQVDQSELTIFKEILDQQIEDRHESLKQVDKIISGIDVEQRGLFGDEPKQESLKLKKTNTKEKIQNELLQLQSARNTLKDREDIPFVWDISFAEIFGEDKHGFDIVIGNPPYVRQEIIADPKEDPKDFRGENSTEWKTAKKNYKEKLMQSVYAAFPDFFHFNPMTKRAKRKINAKNDLFTYFYLHGLSLLNTKGSFCFVTSNSWMDVGYGKDLQEFLLKNVSIKLIIDNKVKRSFQSADVNTIICLFGTPNGVDEQAKFVMFYIPFEECLDAILFEEIDETYGRQITQEYRVVTKDISELTESGMDKEKVGRIDAYTGDKWGGKYLRAPDIYFTILDKGKDKLVRLGDIAKVRRGFTTGANEFFYLTQEKIDEWSIEEEYLSPVIKSPRECKTLYLNPDVLKYKIFICHSSKNELKGTNTLKYIEWGEESVVVNGNETRSFHLRPSCVGRSQWWDLGDRDGTDINCNYLINEIMRFYFYDSPFFVSDNFQEVHYDGNKTSFIISTNSILFALLLNIVGRTNFGGGLMKIQTYEVEDLLTVNPDILTNGSDIKSIFNRDVMSIYEECGFNKDIPIREQEPNPIHDRKILDDIVFDAIGLTEDERKEVYWAVCELVNQRLVKARSV